MGLMARRSASMMVGGVRYQKKYSSPMKISSWPTGLVGPRMGLGEAILVERNVWNDNRRENAGADRT